MKTLLQFAAQQNITFTRQYVDRRPDGLVLTDNSGRHFKCRIGQKHYRKPHKSFTVYFSQGSALTEPPTLVDVLDCLASDSAGFENAKTFHAWAHEYGYSFESREAKKIFRAVQRQAEQLKRILGEDVYQELLFNTERQ